ncbi:MAG: iron-containing alcohol dehydrogenase [Desulfofustis sp.]|nr:iron-containing alcohol dehydrogenase [Desulfofustis sp.]
MDIGFSLKPLPAISFGTGSIEELNSIVHHIGSKFLTITGPGFRARYSRWSSLEKQLRGSGVSLDLVTISGEPSPEIIDQIVDSFFPQKLDGVIAIGGGSVLDAGKAVAAMLPAGKKIEQFLEGVGCRQPDGKSLPFVAVPTTAGTGSEASANAVVTRPGPNGYKKSLRHQNYIPDYALIDPQLMQTCPQKLTAACSMDAFSQLVEGFLSNQASPMTDAIAWSGIEAVERSLVKVCHHGDDLRARTDMAYAALCSGIVLANAGLGIIHGLAPALGSIFSISHGVVCGTLMGSGNAITLEKLSELFDSDPHCQSYIDKYNRLGYLFCGPSVETHNAARCFVEKLHYMIELLKLPRLAELGVSSDSLDKVVETASNKNNPVLLSPEEIKRILLNRL